MGNMYATQNTEADIYAFVDTEEDFYAVVEAVKNLKKDMFFDKMKKAEKNSLWTTKIVQTMGIEHSDLDNQTKEERIKEVEKQIQEKIDNIDAIILNKYAKEFDIFNEFDLDLDKSVNSEEERFLLFTFEHKEDFVFTEGSPATRWEPAEPGEIIGKEWDSSTVRTYFNRYLRFLDIEDRVYDIDVDSRIDDLDRIYEKAREEDYYRDCDYDDY